MKNKQFIRILDRVNPSEEQKEKILQFIQNKKVKKRIYWNSIFKYGTVVAYLFLMCFVMKGFFKEEKRGYNPASYEPRAYMETASEFCYQDCCYQEFGITNELNDFEFVESIFDIQKEKTVNIYKGNSFDIIILEYDNSYFLYQKLERE